MVPRGYSHLHTEVCSGADGFRDDIGDAAMSVRERDAKVTAGFGPWCVEYKKGDVEFF